MPDSRPATPVPDNLEQQRKRAKDLLRAAKSSDASALARIRVHHADVVAPKLSDAQLVVAREAGFASWPKLLAHLQEGEVRAFRSALDAHDVAAARQVLASSRFVRSRINAPMFHFGQRAAHVVANDTAMLDLLIAFGADLNLRSDWANGPYTVLDQADERSARFLIARGARLTPNVAARLGWMDDLQRFVESDAAAVHERGGDGQQPLHQAKTPDIADYLLDHGSEIDTRCIDHKSTPAQYALADRPDVCRRLLERGATPDIFMAARLGDVALAEKVLRADRSAVAARVNEPGYDLVPPFNIYCWTLGFSMSPHAVALHYGHREVYDLLWRHSQPTQKFLEAAMRGNEALARGILAEHPQLLAALTPSEHGRLALAIFHEQYAAAELMLQLGFDPSAPGVDGGSALHAAAWVGHAGLVERLLRRPGVDVELRDATHGSTPLGWAAFGSAQRRAKAGDYVRVVTLLVDAGARVDVPGNRDGMTYVGMAAGNPGVTSCLRAFRSM